MADQWTMSRLEQMIRDEVEESLTLEYKAADSFGKNDARKKEMTKDVSAMANSAGGIIIYGIKEYDNAGKKHLPEKIDPIPRADYPREWLEQVLSNIEPKIDDLIIQPVPINNAEGNVVYVIEIPKGDTAYQAQDLRYYKRYNFQSLPMHDYEIRDVMGRNKNPVIEVDMVLMPSRELRLRGLNLGLLELQVFYRNVGRIYAQYVNGFVLIPSVLFGSFAHKKGRQVTIEGVEYRELLFENIHEDIVGVEAGIPSEFRYVTRYDPLLPGLGRTYTVRLGIGEDNIVKHRDSLIQWTIYADNSPKRQGQIRLGEIELRD